MRNNSVIDMENDCVMIGNVLRNILGDEIKIFKMRENYERCDIDYIRDIPWKRRCLLRNYRCRYGLEFKQMVNEKE